MTTDIARDRLAFTAVVLNDGETYTNIGGCVILEVPTDIPEEDIDHWIKENSQARGQDVAAFYYR